MSNKPSPVEPWDLKEFAFYGALLGLFFGVVNAYVHAFWSQPHDHNEIKHILWMMVVYVGAGAALSATLAVIRNRLMRRCSKRGKDEQGNGSS
ncbi:hypothetical protein ILT44_27930 [Microvirga sp. BT689]|uniref:hypothetical protein n=1 Tax=Microvirga arvi TaxID=2778731 RepID=UPI0019516758|nr:hypothetical protein [Microvirga arvi]MBM6584034.1 hypothetical protein [Microvirga arvi]